VPPAVGITSFPFEFLLQEEKELSAFALSLDIIELLLIWILAARVILFQKPQRLSRDEIDA
jgi:hypothetical protein